MTELERIVHDPVNLGGGWVSFNFEAAFGRPTKILNDAAMQASPSTSSSAGEHEAARRAAEERPARP